MSRFANDYQRLWVLTAFAAGRQVTQRSLAAELSISLGSANALLRSLERDSLIAVNRGAAVQLLRYAVTEAGRAELNRLGVSFAL